MNTYRQTIKDLKTSGSYAKSDDPARKNNVYHVDCWIHAHYCVDVESDSWEEAVQLVEMNRGTPRADLSGLDVGDSGITGVEDPSGVFHYTE